MQELTVAHPGVGQEVYELLTMGYPKLEIIDYRVLILEATALGSTRW